MLLEEYGGAIDALVVKLSADGSQLLYSTYLGGSGRDEGFDVAVDDSGNVYVTGKTASDNFPRANAYQSTFGGDEEAFVAKIASDGSLTYSTVLGGDEEEQAWSIVADSSGGLFDRRAGEPALLLGLFALHAKKAASGLSRLTRSRLLPSRVRRGSGEGAGDDRWQRGPAGEISARPC